ncbi:MoaD/ThiS family protein [Salinicoccus halitifaciens]|uniref:Molybdopterin synthase sulfur carrier subunit n=1 Tax=Salinicoccus halitifaciens TaxID=1073415 RepID=A0ABV2EBS4_9STAP|nr:MoaD/ThiS family protein [Salinicoccus halitifaciens]MCD2138904.1 MoaD/ThiS family protein [Salinicoccus halitifaciens]
MRVMLFAGLKEKAGNQVIELETDGSMKVSDLKERIYADYPSLEGEVFQVASNEAFVKDDHTLTSGDTIALIPPVSGG